jgi:hypothetical protein
MHRLLRSHRAGPVTWGQPTNVQTPEQIERVNSPIRACPSETMNHDRTDCDLPKLPNANQLTESLAATDCGAALRSESGG